jgi:regulator of PEP synthase PpsR (kinase-PPPase family)
MSNTYQIYLISDSTGETLDRIFTAIKAQFKNIDYKVHTYSFTRTENQILKILSDAERYDDSIILYSIVDSNLAKYLASTSNEKNIPCFGVLGDLILSFSKLLNQKASHQPSGQYVLNDEYYKRIAAIQFTMNHDDGNLVKEINKSDIVLLGVSRTSKTPTSIYLANKGFKTSNIPLVNENSIPKILKENPKIACVVGLNTEPERLADIRKNRMNTLKETENKSYTDIEKIKREVDNAKNTFRKYKWPSIDVTRKSVEETAASIIKIHEIYLNNAK